MLDYQPRLLSSELREAAALLQRGAVVAQQQRRAILSARQQIAATGFSGRAPRAALARFTGFEADFHTSHLVFTQAAQVLSDTAVLQERLDALVVTQLAPRAVRALHLLSEALDRRCASALRALQQPPQTDARCLASEHAIERRRGHRRLSHNLDTDLTVLHERNLALIDAPSRRAVLLAQGQVLEAGPGSATVAIGDTITPERVITLVAGATTGKPEQLAGELLKAQHIHARTGATVVVWQGYDPPPTIPEALHRARARQGADNLSEFQAALEYRYPGVQKTVVAHSYGTRVATEAAAIHGLVADDLWLLGSAGVAGQSVADYHLASEEARVYTVDAHNDPILHTRSGPNAVLGTSPAYGEYGAVQVEGVQGGHSDYFSDSAFLSALTQSGAAEGGRRKE